MQFNLDESVEPGLRPSAFGASITTTSVAGVYVSIASAESSEFDGIASTYGTSFARHESRLSALAEWVERCVTSAARAADMSVGVQPAGWRLVGLPYLRLTTSARSETAALATAGNLPSQSECTHPDLVDSSEGKPTSAHGVVDLVTRASAAHTSFAAAVCGALSELVERQTLARFWTTKRVTRVFSPNSHPSASVAFTVQRLTDMGVTVRLVDLGRYGPRSFSLCVLRDQAGGPDYPQSSLGLGSASSTGEAAAKALREAVLVFAELTRRLTNPDIRGWARENLQRGCNVTLPGHRALYYAMRRDGDPFAFIDVAATDNFDDPASAAMPTSPVGELAAWTEYIARSRRSIFWRNVAPPVLQERGWHVVEVSEPAMSELAGQLPADEPLPLG